MPPWVSEIAKEVVVALLVAAFSWIAQLVSRLTKDLNSNFEKIRCLEKRVSDLEYDIDDLGGNRE